MPTWAWILTLVLTVPSAIYFVVLLFGRQRYESFSREETLYFTSQKAIISYVFRIHPARVPFICKLIYLIKPFQIKWTASKYVSKLCVCSLVEKNDFNDEIGSIKNVNIKKMGNNVTIIWPKGKLVGDEIKRVEVLISGQITRDDIKDRLKIMPQQTAAGKSKKRWRYELTNKSEATIRDFELDITEIAQNPMDIVFIEARPNETSEADILVRAEDSIDRYKKGEEIRICNVIWQLPKIEKKGELILILEC